jgi:hypothetical protein
MPQFSSPLACSHRRTIACLLVVAGLIALSGAAAAQVLVTPGGGIVFVSSDSKAVGVDDPETQEGPDYGVWGTTLLSHAHDNGTGADASAYMTMTSSIDTTGFYVTSTGAAQISGSNANTSGGGFASVLFIADQCQQYSGSTLFDPTTLGPLHVAAFVANVSLKDVALTNMLTQVGNSTFRGRIAPGTYLYFYENGYGPSSLSGYVTTISNSIRFERVLNPLVTQHPHDQTVAAGSSASFSVGTSSLATGVSSALVTTAYQWRRNYQNLSNGVRISGANGTLLQIASTVPADTGFYDCVVTRDTIVEPSSLARLVVTGGNTDAGPASTITELALAAPSPNPFARSTRIRFSLPSAAEVRLQVLDVAGRQVKELVGGERREAGQHFVEWDGGTQRGERAASGMYFVRLQAGTKQLVQRVVRISP